MIKHLAISSLKKCITFLIVTSLFILVFRCSKIQKAADENIDSAHKTNPVFKADVDFLKKYTHIILLQNSTGKAKVAISAALQGRVMTSTSEGDEGVSYGWINRAAFLSGDTSKHFNVFGGEDRLWLGPEGGQYSIYFAKGTEFNLENWYVPRVIDLEAFSVASVSEREAVFTKEAQLVNYSGTPFHLALKRTVKVLEDKEALDRLGVDSAKGISLVAFETVNELKNTGVVSWQKETGLLSIWILGMFNPAPGTTIIVPYHGSKNNLKEIVNDNYFGKVPEDRLKLVGKTIFFKADGKYRSKIGLAPENAPEWLGSYDLDQGVLTVVQYSKPTNGQVYVNSMWEIQKEPYRGDAVNAYNDGPSSPGAKPLGPFYELESSSPAAELDPEASLRHTHTTYHFKGTTQQLDPIMRHLFGIPTNAAASVF